MDHVLHFQKRKLVKGRVVTSYRGLAMAIVLKKLTVQGWTNLLLQGDVQRIFVNSKVYKFYTNGIERDDVFSLSMRGVAINFATDDLARSLDVPLGS